MRRICTTLYLFAFLSSLTVSPSQAATERIKHVRAASLNIKIDLSLADAIADTREAANENPDFISFQEIGGDVQARYMKTALTEEGYGFVRPAGPAKNVPVAFNNSRWDKVQTISWHLSDETFVRAEGAGPKVLRAKEATVVMVKNANKKLVAAVSLHLCPEPELNDVRAQLHASQIDRLVKLNNRLLTHFKVDEIVMAGDFNTNNIDLLQPLLDVGLKVGPFINTHPDGAIDHVLSTMATEDVYKREVHSDHDLLIANL